MSRLLVAVPGRTAEDAVRTAVGAGDVAGFVVGPELLAGPGPAVVSALASQGPVMVLAGLHGDADRAATAARRFVEYGAHWVTTQAKDGPGLVSAVVASGVNTVAITLRHGQGDAEAASLFGSSRGRTVSRLAEMAVGAGARGILCDLSDLGVVAQVADEIDRFVWASTSVEAAEATERGATFVMVEADLADEVRRSPG